MPISKIIIPAAGLGTRFLPITKTVPKELLPLLAKPALQEVVEEAIAAGIHDFYLVINEDKMAIKSYLTHPDDRHNRLKHNASSALKRLDALIASNNFHYLDQPEMRGLGHAISLAKNSIHDDFFGVILPDDLIFSDEPAIAQLMKKAERYKATIVAVMEVPRDQISAYGSIKPGNKIDDDMIEIIDIIEKPQPEKAFSNLGIIGRYIFTPAIFDAIAAITPLARGEIQLTDAITHLAQTGHPVFAYKVKGQPLRYRPPRRMARSKYLCGTSFTRVWPYHTYHYRERLPISHVTSSTRLYFIQQSPSSSF